VLIMLPVVMEISVLIQDTGTLSAGATGPQR
jgi:hypothetical protein